MIFVQRWGPICPALHSDMSNIAVFCLGNITLTDPWERCFKNWKQFRYNISTFSSSKQYMMTLLIEWLSNYVQNSLAKILNSVNNGYHVTGKTRSLKANRIRNKSRESVFCVYVNLARVNFTVCFSGTPTIASLLKLAPLLRKHVSQLLSSPKCRLLRLKNTHVSVHFYLQI